jgi:predicted nuclease of restriction endonuclease-like (RecB) superfamily
LAAIKLKIRQVQLKAAVKVNTELLTFYWELGVDIVQKQAEAKWGDGLIGQLSKDLSAEFPDIKGFSRTNLLYIRQWYMFYFENFKKIPQAVGQMSNAFVKEIFQVPWGHNREIVAKCKTLEEAVFYVRNTIKHNWSRAVLVHQIEWGLFRREGKAVNNFALTLPKPHSDLAMQTLNDPYIFDFLAMTKDYDERELEKALTGHITTFLLELGTGFAYVGRQIPLHVGESEFFIDLLFYHLKLRCYVVIELKTVAFQPEFAGKLNFYVTAVDRRLRNELDRQTIGIFICKTKDKVVAEYSLSDIKKPLGISEYRLTQSLPKKFKSSLPSIQEIKAGLSGDGNKEK